MTTPLDVYADLYLGDAWVDVSSYVRQDTGLEITDGSQPESLAGFGHGELRVVFDGRDGQLVPGNPDSAWYGQLGQNTPLRAGLRQSVDAFGRSVSSGWGTTDTGQVWSTTGAGGVVAASDYNVAAGVGTHSVPAASAYRATYLATVAARDVDVAVTVTMAGVTAVTGGALEPANILLRGQDTSDYYIIRVKVTTTQTVTVEFHSAVDGVFSTVATVPGLVWASGRSLRVRAQVEGWQLRAKVWDATLGEPYGWHLTWVDEPTPSFPNIVEPGFVGIRSGVAAGNTNTSPVVFAYDSWEVRSPQSATELAAGAPEWDTSGNDITVPVKAAGIVQRLANGDPLASAPRRWYPTDGSGDATNVIAYWPLEDTGSSGYGLEPLVGVHQMVIVSARAPELHRGKGVLAPWLAPCVALLGGSDSIVGKVDMPTGWVNTDGWMVDYTRAGGATTDTRLVVAAGVLGPGGWTASQAWIVECLAATKQVRITLPGGTTSTGSATALFDGAGHHMRLAVSQSGANISYAVTIDDTTVPVTGSLLATTLEAVVQVAILDDTAHTDPFAVGHVAVYDLSYGSSTPNAASAVLGHQGEAAGRRFQRLCVEEGIEVSWQGDLDNTPPMGPQYPKGVIALLEECIAAAQGVGFEARGTHGLVLRPAGTLTNQDPRLTLDYTAGDLSPGYRPEYSHAQLRNDVTARNAEGVTYRAQQLTGRLSVLPPSEGGAGRKPATVDGNVTAGLVQDVAGWQLHLGTVDEYRYPRIPGNFLRTGLLARQQAALDVGIGDRVVVANPKSILPPADGSVLAVGRTLTLSRYVCDVEFNGVPESPYRTWILDDPACKIGSSTASVVGPLSSSATSLYLADTYDVWTTTAGQMPIPVTIGGEDLSITDIDAVAASFVGADAAVTADNASVTPTIHASATTADHLLLIAASRGVGTVTINTTALEELGWEVVADLGNFAALQKIHDGAEPNPTVTLTGSLAGATVQAQILVHRGLTDLGATATTQTNASAQNIAYPALTVPAGQAGSVIVYAARKSDDLTSCTGPGTEVAENSTTTGDDQSMPVYREIQGSRANITAGSITVTGGAAAVSQAMVIALRPAQLVTCTRSANGVTKAHTAGAPVRLTRRNTVAYYS